MSLPKAKIKKAIIETAKDNPLVSYVCHKHDISRATYYRWIQDDPKFKKRVEKAKEIGREAICDMAESKIMNHMKSNNENISLNAAKFVLNNNSPNYRTTNSFSRERRRLKEKLMKINEIEETQVDEILDCIRGLIEKGQRLNEKDKRS